MRIAFNPSTVAALTSPPNNKDITFDLRGQNIFARGVKFYGTDTNTWRDIKINNVSIGSNILDLRNGSNTTLTNTNGVVTINSTWRPVVDNLTSNSTTSSLSANQGRVLAGLINGKSDSDHNHDDRYLKLTGGTMSGTIYRNSGGTTIRGRDHAIIRQTYAPGGSSWNPIACVDTETGTWTLGHLSNGDSDTRFSFCFSTNVDYNAGYNQGNYVHIRNIDGTLALTSEIPNKNSWNYDDRYYTKAESDIKYITDITTSVNKLTFTKNGSNIARDITVNNVQSQGQLPNIADQDSTTKADSGLYIYDSYSQTIGTNFYSSVLSINTGGTIQIAGDWGDDHARNLYWRSQSDRNVADYPWKSWRTILDNENYSSTLDSRYYTETEVNSLLDAKLNRQNLSYGTWNPRSYNLAADYRYNGGDLSISESGGQIHVSVDGYFWQNEGRYRVLDTSDVAGLKGDLTVHQYLSNTDTTWWPLIWGGSSHANTSDSTGAVYKSHDVLSWQTSSQTLYAIHLRTTFIDLENNRGISRVTSGGTSPFKGIQLPDLQSNGVGIFSKVGEGAGADEGGVIISADTSVIYNSFDTGWGLTIRDKDKGQMDISGNGTIAFGVRQDYRAYSLGGFEKAGSSNSYVLLGGGDHKLESALNVSNADTVDGEHANNFVRAGVYDSSNLNSLDTYSFIKSVESTVASASPNGNTGWYNVIQAVHRNGAIDGPNYIGQIALGMTTNLSAMFYRTKHKGSWYAWNEVVTTNTGLLRYSRNNVNISSPNCSPIPPSLLEWTVGYPRLYDPEFNEGDNKVRVYNNAGNGVVTVTRVHDTNVGNSSSYVMKVVSASGASPNYGGWCVPTQTELGKVYTCLFRASIPSGVEIEWNSNSIGSGGQMSWLTNNMGTGKWTWYAVQVYCGSGGSDTFYFSAKSPCTWYLSYVNVIENNRASYAGLRSVYSDYLKQNASIVFGRNELQYFNQYTGVTAGATNNANPKTDWYHILRMNHANNSGYFVDLAIPFFDNKIQFRRITNGSDNGWRRVITEEPNHDVILREASTDGNVGIGINNPAYKLDVNGQMRAEGFHHWTVNSDNYILLAGGGYKSFGGDNSNPIFLGYLNLYHGNDGTISSSFSCLGYSVPFTYTRGGNYCRIYIPDTTHQVFYIGAATASVHYSGGGMDTWTGVHRGSGAWWLHCYAEGTNEVRVKGFCQNNNNNDSWWGGNPLWSGNDGANKITVCIFGYVKFR